MNWTKAILSGLLFSVLATAGTLTYTEQGYLSGSLGNTTFTNALVTFSVGGTPSAIHFAGNEYWDVFPGGRATVTIAGIPGTATIANIALVAAWLCDSSCATGAGFGFDANGIYTELATLDPIFGTYDLTTPIGPVSGGAFGTAANLDTDKGLFVISSYTGTTTIFTASSVPEPGSLGLLAGAAALLLAARRRFAC